MLLPLLTRGPYLGMQSSQAVPLGARCPGVLASSFNFIAQPVTLLLQLAFELIELRLALGQILSQSRALGCRLRAGGFQVLLDLGQVISVFGRAAAMLVAIRLKALRLFDQLTHLP